MKPGWIRLSVPWYASRSDVDYMLRSVEFVADRGEDFLPVYRLGWRDGTWTHMEAACEPAPEVAFSVESLLGNGTDAVESIEDSEIQAERERYLTEARASADALRARWDAEKPRRNQPTGDSEVDSLCWFRYNHTDAFPGE
jgi:hypothetical protein